MDFNLAAFKKKHEHFNYVLSSLRITIECVFGRLKGRFRRFRAPQPYGGSMFMAQLFICACVLHNFIETTRMRFMLAQYIEHRIRL